MRTSFSAAAPFPMANLEIKRPCGGFVDEKHRPCIRPQKLVNFFHDGAENLLKLKGTGEGFSEYAEHGDYPRGPAELLRREIAAAVNTFKIVCVRHSDGLGLLH